jgi:DNA-binding transcriptional regulator YiaG
LKRWSRRHGVKESDIRICFNFVRAALSKGITVSRSYEPSRPVRIPTTPKSIGDHIRLRRISAKLRQKDIATRFRVTESCLFNWESGATTPEIRYLPAIIEFLGYNPLPHGKTLAQRLLRHRSSLGLTRRATIVGVDASTLARWERGERQPTGSALELVERFLKQSRPQNSPTRVA